MKKTMLEFKKELDSFYGTLGNNITLYFCILIAVSGVAICGEEFSIFRYCYDVLAIVFCIVWSVYLLSLMMKFFFLEEDFQGLRINYFASSLIMTLIADAKSIVKLFKK